MLLAEAGCMFLGLILYISGVQGRANSICALKGSSVDLLCSAKHPTSSMKWYTVHRDGSDYVLNEISADGNHITYNMSEGSNFTLTIKDLRESDGKSYCCRKSSDKPELCWINRTELRVADLQVKVIPATEGQTVTLMCSTSCPLTENPAAYIWYKNRELLYRDWSPWYQQLVSSDGAVRYSCAVKGYKDLRAPEVSVDSLTPTCFSVTYAKGRMCSYNQTSEDEPCSITYPTEVHVHRTSESPVELNCTTSCPLTDPKPAYSWYQNGKLFNSQTQTISVSSPIYNSFSCAVKYFEDLMSAELCAKDKDCWSVNYVSRRICALEGSSVNISCEYSHPNREQPKSKLWYKKRSGNEEAEELKAAGRLKYHDNMKSHHILTINNPKKNDTALYTFRLQKESDGKWKQSNSPGVTLVVTGLRVKFTPAADVTEGQRVTLTCSTSCPLTDNTNYIWYLNGRPLTLPENQNKHLVLDPVSRQHAGNYSCEVKTSTKNITSGEKTLTVQNIKVKQTLAAAAGVGAVLLVITPITVFLWLRRKRSSSQSTRTESSDILEQLNPGSAYDGISAQPTEQDALHYSRVHFPQDHADALYSTVQTQEQEQEHIVYAVVNFRCNMTTE